jgi:hypothetical protein
MSTPFFAHHEIRYSADQTDQKGFSHESIFHKIWVTFLFVVFFLLLFVFL